MVRFRVFAMYVRTELVHTYIVKRPSFLLYRFLAVPKMGTATSIIKIWVGDSPTPCWQGKGVVKHDIHLTWSVLTWLWPIWSQPLQGSNKRLRPLKPFAGCVCTGLVHTYIAKRPSSPIYSFIPRGKWASQAVQVPQFPDSPIRGGLLSWRCCWCAPGCTFSGWQSRHRWSSGLSELPGCSPHTTSYKWYRGL